MSVELNTEETTEELEVSETEQTNTTNGSENLENNSDQSTETVEFDAAEFEQSLGLPSGALADAKDEDEALAVARDFIDKSLVAGIGFAGGADVPEGSVSQKPDKTAADQKTAKASSNPELDALRAELVEVKTSLKQREENERNHLRQELDRRIAAEIDSWGSPKYGVGKNRSFNQIKASRELHDLLNTHIAGHQATGQGVPQVEALLKQVRVFHDESFKPGKKSPSDQKPLGTPGTGSKMGKGDDKPRSIHHALQQNPF